MDGCYGFCYFALLSPATQKAHQGGAFKTPRPLVPRQNPFSRGSRLYRRHRRFLSSTPSCRVLPAGIRRRETSLSPRRTTHAQSRPPELHAPMDTRLPPHFLQHTLLQHFPESLPQFRNGVLSSRGRRACTDLSRYRGGAGKPRHFLIYPHGNHPHGNHPVRIRWGSADFCHAHRLLQHPRRHVKPRLHCRCGGPSAARCRRPAAARL